MKFIFSLFLLAICFPFGSAAQCAHPVLVSQLNINEISDPYQLTFLHDVPKNRVDSLVQELLVRDIKHLTDFAKVVEEIGKTRSDEGFWLLYVAALGPTVFYDLTIFGSLSSTIRYYGGFQVLNTYYLKGGVDESHPESEFQQEVIRQCSLKKPEIYYCPQRNQLITKTRLQREIDAQFNEYEPCANPVLVTGENIIEIHNPYEFTFIHKAPQNRVDSLVEKLLTYHFQSAQEGIDCVEDIGKTGSPEGFQFLFACCAAGKVGQYRYTAFFQLANQVIIWGGYQVLEKYYSHSSVNEQLPILKYRSAVVDLAADKVPPIYYCNQPTIQELYEAELTHIPIRKYDRKIIRIIRRNSNLRKENTVSHLTTKVFQLPFVEDVLWDGCHAKLSIYPPYYNLMVRMSVGDHTFERSYNMKGAKFRFFGIRLGKNVRFGRTIETNKKKLVYSGAGYCPDCIKDAREYCEEQRKRDNEE